MLYLIALILPPLGVLFAGKIFTSILLAIVWFAAVAFTFGVAHPVFVILAWIIIASAKGDKRHKQTLKGRG